MPFAEEFTLLTSTVTGQDDDGNDVYDTTSSIIKGAFAPAGSTELIQGQATVITHDTLYLDEGQAVPTAQDQVVARGRTYKVDGTPGEYKNVFTGWTPGAVVRLMEVTG